MAIRNTSLWRCKSTLSASPMGWSTIYFPSMIGYQWTPMLMLRKPRMMSPSTGNAYAWKWARHMLHNNKKLNKLTYKHHFTCRFWEKTSYWVRVVGATDSSWDSEALREHIGNGGVEEHAWFTDCIAEQSWEIAIAEKRFRVIFAHLCLKEEWGECQRILHQHFHQRLSLVSGCLCSGEKLNAFVDQFMEACLQMQQCCSAPIWDLLAGPWCPTHQGKVQEQEDDWKKCILKCK